MARKAQEKNARFQISLALKENDYNRYIKVRTDNKISVANIMMKGVELLEKDKPIGMDKLSGTEEI